MEMHWNCIDTNNYCKKDTVGGSLKVINLLMAMYGGLVTQIAANEEQYKGITKYGHIKITKTYCICTVACLLINTACEVMANEYNSSRQ